METVADARRASRPKTARPDISWHDTTKVLPIGIYRCEAVVGLRIGNHRTASSDQRIPDRNRAVRIATRKDSQGSARSLPLRGYLRASRLRGPTSQIQPRSCRNAVAERRGFDEVP